MKTSLFFLFIFSLLTSFSVANGLLTRSDTTISTEPVSYVSVRPDSIRPIEPSLILTGNLELTKGYYTLRDAVNSNNQNSPWYLNGTFILTTPTGWTIPLLGVWSTPSDGDGQTYNTIGISPRYKNWLTLHGGYRNLEFSPFTLASHTVLGAGIELNPGVLRVGLMAGQFNKAVEANEANPDQGPAFRRMGYCAKLGIGTDRTYLDIILLHAADDIHSIRADTVAGITPAENAILSLSGRIRTNRKLTIELDAAGSAYTSDTQAKSVPTTGLTDNPIRVPKHLYGLGKLIAIRQTTSIRTALQASFSYRVSWGDLKLRYKRIEPGYQSMGTYYLQTDLERFTVTPSVWLLKKRLQLRSSLGWQHDNLFHQKRTRNERLIGSASLSYASDSNLTLGLTTSNYSATQRAGTRPLNDSVRVDQINRTVSGSVSKYWVSTVRTHSLNGSATYQVLQDLNPFINNHNQSQTWSYTLDYRLQQSASRLNLNISYNYTDSYSQELSFLVHGPTVSVEKKMGKERTLNVLLMASYLKNKQILNGSPEQSVAFNTTLTLDYQLTPVHRLSVNSSLLLNQGAQLFRQQQGTIQYTMVF